MKRYESGERELNKEEKEFAIYLASTGQAVQPLAFDTFLSNMREYQSKKTSGRRM